MTTRSAGTGRRPGRRPKPGARRPRPGEQPKPVGSFPWKPLVAVLAGAGLVTALVLIFWPSAAPAGSRGACDIVVDVTGQPGYEWVQKTINEGEDSVQQECRDRLMLANLIVDRSANSPCNEVKFDTYVEPTGSSLEDEDLRKKAWEGYFTSLSRLATCGTYGSEDADPGTTQPVQFEGSDLLTAIDVAGQELDQVEGEKTLYLASDMINSMPPLKRMPTAKQIETTVQELDSAGVIPDMSGVDVRVIGLGTNSKLDARELAVLEQFWDAYFDAAQVESVDFVQTLN